jgi:hypothetical protein
MASWFAYSVATDRCLHVLITTTTKIGALYVTRIKAYHDFFHIIVGHSVA